ncbi:MAG: hypothetical protein M1825_001686 [Sarcosagium campestre]|nr:MAG: hypothetical protein M1825_001686 [Sarcosagium campestre]
MARRFTAFAVILLELLTVSAIPWNGPLQTPEGNLPNAQIAKFPEPTKAPNPRFGLEMMKRAASIVDPAICGWEEGDPDAPYTDPNLPGSTCYFDTDLNVVGYTYSITRLGFVGMFTTCQDYLSRVGKSCGISCSSNTLLCDTINPYCETAYFPSGFSRYTCATSSSITKSFALTYSGQETAIAFPRFSGNKGISFGTQEPSGASSSESSSGPDESASASGTSAAETASSAKPTKTDGGDDKSSSTPIGAIVGGAIGGVVIIAVAATVIAWLIIRSRRQQAGGSKVAAPQMAPAGQWGTPSSTVPAYTPAPAYPASEQATDQAYFAKPELASDPFLPVGGSSPGYHAGSHVPSHTSEGAPLYEAPGR